MSQLSIKNKFISTVRVYPLASFFILAYLGSWIGWSPWWLSQTGVGLLPYELPHSAVAGINQLGLIAGPLVAVFVVTRIVSGRKGVKQLQKSFAQWRVHPLAYILAFVAIPLAICAAYFLFGGVRISSDISPAIITTLLVTFVIYLAGGPIQEEGGWRGFALPRLQQRYHPLVAAVILGVVHCLWHAPLFFTSEWDTARGDVSQLWAYLVLVVSMSVVMSWIVNKARGSVFLAILAHNSVNWSLFIVATLSGGAVANNWPAALGLTVLAIVAIIATRGRLAFEQEQNTLDVSYLWDCFFWFANSLLSLNASSTYSLKSFRPSLLRLTQPLIGRSFIIVGHVPFRFSAPSYTVRADTYHDVICVATPTQTHIFRLSIKDMLPNILISRVSGKNASSSRTWLAMASVYGVTTSVQSPVLYR